MSYQTSNRAAARDVALGFLAERLDDSSLDVLPYVPEAWIDDAFARHSTADTDLVLREKIVPISWVPTLVLHAVVTHNALVQARARGLKVVARLAPEHYRAAIRRHHGERLRRAATYTLARTRPGLSAHARLTSGQKAAAFALAGVAAAMLAAGRHLELLAAFTVMAMLFFTLVISIKLFCLLPEAQGPPRPPPRLPDHELPVYTVLVPLFRETEVLDQLISALLALDYPRAQLDIKLIVEETDTSMQRAVAARELPDHFEVLVVPAGQPQTKPRALNYGLAFARGALLTIYDAEDIPHPAQLRLAAERFAHEEPSLACLQAALTFYNPTENWLTRQFAADYGALFQVMLPALAAHQLPIPLGGTSNHFQTRFLRIVGGWDAFNVTEDADLGLRFARAGLRCDVLPSCTAEEANTQVGNWLKQRRRWLKGFLQTWLVHMRHPLELHRDLGTQGFWTFQCLTLGVFASALLHPLLLVYSIIMFLPEHVAVATASIAGQIVAGLALAVLAGGYGIAMAIAAAGMMRAGLARHMPTIFTIPLYWMLQSAAAWAALWDFIIRPFHWHKTRHGLSRHFHKDRVSGPIATSGR